jgi:hypothetical protein
MLERLALGKLFIPEELTGANAMLFADEWYR